MQNRHLQWHHFHDKIVNALYVIALIALLGHSRCDAQEVSNVLTTEELKQPFHVLTQPIIMVSKASLRNTATFTIDLLICNRLKEDVFVENIAHRSSFGRVINGKELVGNENSNTFSNSKIKGPTQCSLVRAASDVEPNDERCSDENTAFVSMTASSSLLISRKGERIIPNSNSWWAEIEVRYYKRGDKSEHKATLRTRLKIKLAPK